MEQDVTGSPASGHLLGKLKRQRAILDAACAIIETDGEAGLNMRALAARAGVSPATPYNLFGSKQAVLQAVYDEDTAEFYEHFLRHASGDPLTRLFDMIDLAIAHWQRTPDFHKALISTLYRGGAAAAEASVERPRLTFVHARQLVDAAMAAGVLAPHTPAAIVTATLARLFRAAGQEWIDGVLSLDQARQDLGRSFALLLAGLVTPASSDALAVIAARYEADERQRS